MPEPGLPAQKEHLPGKVEQKQETVSGDSLETKTATTDSARVAALKGRKRTKTGCLSKSCRQVNTHFWLIDKLQRAENDVSSAARSALLARIASNPNVTAKAMSLE